MTFSSRSSIPKFKSVCVSTELSDKIAPEILTTGLQS